MPTAVSAAGGSSASSAGVDVRVLPRVVAVEAVERDRPDHARQREEHERVPPRHVFEDVGDEQRRERAAPPRAEPEQPLHALAGGHRQPGREDAGQVRKAAGLAGAEQRARHDERRRAPHPAGRGREERPPQHDAGEDAPRPDPVAEPSARALRRSRRPS